MTVVSGALNLKLHSTFSLTKRSPLQLPRVFFCHEAFKNFALNQTCLICNKGDMALKTSTKMVVYANTCICPGEFSSFV